MAILANLYRLASRVYLGLTGAPSCVSSGEDLIMTATMLLPTVHGQTTRVETLPSTDAKNRFAQLIERVTRAGKPVVITRNARPAAVMLSIAEYERLVQAAPDPLASLQAGFDRLVASMQTPQAQAGVDALFSSTPEQLGAAAVRAADQDKH
jgi:antitoxin Phd